MENVSYIPLSALVPFILMLASIAVMPLAANHIWESNINKLIISLLLGIPAAIWLIIESLHIKLMETILFDYIPFIILLGALFVITGGIFVDGRIHPSPKANTIIFIIGAVLASFMGTTGAAMLLIRPLIKENRVRKHKTHTILFFIAIVANCGGLLTPLGDPPLFMMYLRGAPFEWFLKLIPEWLLTNFILILVYFIYDSILFKNEKLNESKFDYQTKIKVKGNLNFLWLLGVVLAVAIINPNVIPFVRIGHFSSYIREGAILLMAVLSLVFTNKKIREANDFNWGPIIEVAYLFLGIFITMVPCLLYLEINAKTLGINSPLLFYYASGALSSFLDNTPTAVTFHALAEGLVRGHHGTFVAGIPETILKAISVGSVFFGSMTYIGNGPNFMVKAIAERRGIKMPHFFGYMLKFSLLILLPIYILIQLIFIN